MIKEQAKNRAKKEIRKKITKWLLLFLKPFIVPIIVIFIIFLLVCYITDIFFIGIKNEEKSNLKSELKYYTTGEYTEEDSKGFFESVGDFIAGIFTPEIIGNVDYPVVGKSNKDITSYYGKRDAPTSGASTFHSRN